MRNFHRRRLDKILEAIENRNKDRLTKQYLSGIKTQLYVKCEEFDKNKDLSSKIIETNFNTLKKELVRPFKKGSPSEKKYSFTQQEIGVLFDRFNERLLRKQKKLEKRVIKDDSHDHQRDKKEASRGMIAKEHTVRRKPIPVNHPYDEIFSEMYSLCSKDKPNKYAYKVFSGYRSPESQGNLYKNRAKYIRNELKKHGKVTVTGVTYTKKDLTNPHKLDKVVRKTVGSIGGSKHNHGTALDVFFQLVPIPSALKKTKKYKNKKHFDVDDSHPLHKAGLENSKFFKTWKKHAKTFKLYNYKPEPWHWEMKDESIKAWEEYSSKNKKT